MIISRHHAGVIELKGCYSGVRCRPEFPLQRRIALATTAALDRASSARTLTEALERKLLLHRTVDSAAFRTAGFEVEDYFGNFDFHTVGLHLTGEEEPYRAGEKQIISLEPGLHREVFFGIMGIAVEGVADLPPHLYASLLAKLSPNFCRLRSVVVRELGGGIREMTESLDQGIRFVVSPPALEAFGFWAHIEEGWAISNPRSGDV